MVNVEHQKPEVLGIGITGLVGSRIVEILGKKYVFRNLSLETGVDITDPATLEIIKKDTGESIVLHLAAKTDVDGCEDDKPLGENGAAWRINVLGTQNVVEACKKTGKKIIYISTDFVFDGENPPDGDYNEKDEPHPINWYGQTKYEGEKIVQESGLPYLICRLAYPYRARFAPKTDFVRAILGRLGKKEEVATVTDQIFTPTFIDDTAQALDVLIKTEVTGIYHVVGSDWLSPYKAALTIAKTFGFPLNLIREVTAEEYFKNRAKRPPNLALKNDKIKNLGVKMRTFEEGIERVKEQLALRLHSG